MKAFAVLLISLALWGMTSMQIFALTTETNSLIEKENPITINTLFQASESVAVIVENNANSSEIVEGDIHVKATVPLSEKITTFSSVNSPKIITGQFSSGEKADIEYTPSQASEIAEMTLKTNCEESSCTYELKEISPKNNPQLVYEIEAHKKARLVGFIPIDVSESAQINAQTGAVVESSKSWWSFLILESSSPKY